MIESYWSPLEIVRALCELVRAAIIKYHTTEIYILTILRLEIQDQGVSKVDFF